MPYSKNQTINPDDSGNDQGDTGKQPTVSRQPVRELDPNDIRQRPGYLPNSDASGATTRNAQYAQYQVRNNKPDDMPDSAKPIEDITSAVYVPMPSGGIAALAENLFPDDFRNQDAMDRHIYDLMTMNRDRLRDDSGYTVGTQVRIK